MINLKFRVNVQLKTWYIYIWIKEKGCAPNNQREYFGNMNPFQLFNSFSFLTYKLAGL